MPRSRLAWIRPMLWMAMIVVAVVRNSTTPKPMKSRVPIFVFFSMFPPSGRDDGNGPPDGGRSILRGMFRGNG